MKQRSSRGVIGLLTVFVFFVVSTLASENIAAWLEANKLNRLLILVENPAVSAAQSILGFLSRPIFTHLYAAIGGGVVALFVANFLSNGQSVQREEPRLVPPETTLSEAIRYIAKEVKWRDGEDPNRWPQQLRLALTDQLFHGALPAYGRVYEWHEPVGPMFPIPRDFWQEASINIEDYLAGESENRVVAARAGMTPTIWTDVRVYRRELERAFPPRELPKRAKR